MAELFGIHLDESGSNMFALSKFFNDPTGGELRQVLAEAFFTAQYEVTKSTTSKEVWDYVAQNELHQLATQKMLMSPGVKLLLEKEHGGTLVWNYGIRVFTNQSRRPWTLPDALIQSKEEVVAVEFDHGGTLGHWAQQLLKATRLTASSHISGLLFCYCTSKNQRGWFSGGDFTPEFKAIVEGYVKKPVGIVTIGAEELARVRREKAHNTAL